MKCFMALLVLVMCVGMVGCLTTQQNAEINRSSILLAEKLKDVTKLEGQLKDIVAKLKAGVIPVAEGEALYNAIEASIEETTDAAKGFQATIEKIQSEGGSGIDIATGIIFSLVNIAGALLGVRVWRGGVNNRTGNIGLT